MKRIILTILFCSLVIVLLLSGCSNTSTPSAPATAATSAAPAPAPATTSSKAPAPETTSAPAPKPTTSAAPATPQAGQQQYGGTLKISYAAGPTTPIGIPWQTTGQSTSFTYCAIEPLMREDDTGKMNPWLASDYKVSPDNKSVTLTLRQGVKFHDGSDLNAAVVKWNMDSFIQAKMTRAKLWTSIDVVDNNTVKVNLSKWECSALEDIGGTGIISKANYDAKGEEAVKWAPCGTGAFKFVSFQRDVNIIYDKNPNYWQKGKPYLDGLQYVIIANSMTAQAALQAGSIDYMFLMDFKAQNDLKQQGFIIADKMQNTVMCSADSANADSPLAKAKVRQAIEYAIDKASLAKATGYGFLTPAYQVAVPYLYAYDKSIPDRTFDLSKAKQLLSEAGFPNGLKTRLVCDPMMMTKDQATILQGMLANVGITLDLEFPTFAKFQEYLTKGWNNALLSQGTRMWVLWPKYLEFYFSERSVFNASSRFTPPGYMDLLNQSLAATDNQQMLDLSKKASSMLYPDALCIPLFHTTQGVVYRKGINGLNMSPITNQITPEEIWISK
jgi:peptide/nickel transport system substrate-binding protein